MSTRTNFILYFIFIFPLISIGQSLLKTNEQNQNPKTLAYIIGVSNYRHIDSLNYAKIDAEKFIEFLEGQKNYNQFEIYDFLDSSALRSKLYDALNSLKDTTKIKSGDRLIFYFSGHGDMEYFTNNAFLLAYDCPKDNYFNGGIHLDVLHDMIESLARRDIEVILYLDACRSGEIINSKSNHKPISSYYLNFLEHHNLTVIFMSCKPKESSLEGMKYGNGRGTYSGV